MIQCNPMSHIKDHRLSMRIPTDLRKRLEAEAARQDRSIAYVVEAILRRHFHDGPVEVNIVAGMRPTVSVEPVKGSLPLNQRPARPVPKPGAK